MDRFGTKILALALALMLAMGAALAEQAIPEEAGEEIVEEVIEEVTEEISEEQSIENALQEEEQDLSIYYEAKIQLDSDELAVTDGLDSGWRNILLAGGDSRVEGSYGRTDAMVILSVNTNRREVKMTSVMRDIWTPMHGREPQKISAANVFGGPTLMMRTINEDFGMNITDYILVDMAGIETIIDILGGLDLDITANEMRGLNASWNRDGSAQIEPLTEYGENIHLNSEQVLAYARLRSIDNDYQRTARQRAVLVAMARQATQVESSDMLNLIRECMNSVETNLSMTDVIQLAVLATQVDLEQIEQFRIPADDAYTTGYEGKLWVIWPDFEENTRQLYDFIYGEN